MISIEYNNKEYLINNNSLLTNLLSREDLKDLPMIKWKELLTKLDGRCYFSMLFLVLINNINYYDKSPKVNSFIYDGKQYWFSKEIRISLLNIANNTKGDIELVLGDNIIKINGKSLKLFLINLETYAQKCFVVTQKHLNAVKELHTLEDLLNYDYTKEYPEKLVLNVE